MKVPPILREKACDAPSVFVPESLLREARRQKGLAPSAVPGVCLLDPDGDVLRHLKAAGRARRDEGWACYHTHLWRFEAEGAEFGLVACAVGAPFAVLVAEELFASGCALLVSVTSSGQIRAVGAPPYFVLIERALRDEGTSYHYLPAGDWAELGGGLRALLGGAFDALPVPVHHGATWTTDAPFRETAQAIAAAEREGILAVEMEAAALYAFAEARERPVVCFAHVTNRMGAEGDFEKGADDGSGDVVRLLVAAARAFTAR